jgi:hypothetical protein
MRTSAESPTCASSPTQSSSSTSERSSWPCARRVGSVAGDRARGHELRPDEADFVIPGNDDAIRSCSLIIRAVADGIEAGKAKATPQDFAPQAEESEPGSCRRARAEADAEAETEPVPQEVQ